MSAELLSSIVGVLLSLVMSYVPGVSAWWDLLDGEWKRAIMGALLIATGGAVYAGACQGYWEGVACGEWQSLANAVLAALLANQAAYKITKG